jgi:integrase
MARRIGISGPYKHGRRWRVVCQTDGTRTVRSFEIEEEAQAFVDEWRRLAEGESVTDAAERWIAMLRRDGRAVSTIKARRNQIDRILGRLPFKVHSVTPRMAQKAYESLVATGCANDTHHNSLEAAKQMWRALFRGASPWDGVKPIGERHRGKDQLTMDESRRLLRAAVDLGELEPGGVAAALCLCLALRASEVTGLVSRDIDDGGRLLWVQRGKTKKSRRVLEVPEVLRPLLVRYAAIANGGRLFPYSRNWPGYWTRQVCMAANVRRVTAHGLRGTHATLARQAGATAHLVAAALGHASPAVTRQHYFAPGVEDYTDARQLGNNLVTVDRMTGGDKTSQRN